MNKKELADALRAMKPNDRLLEKLSDDMIINMAASCPKCNYRRLDEHHHHQMIEDAPDADRWINMTGCYAIIDDRGMKQFSCHRCGYLGPN